MASRHWPYQVHSTESGGRGRPWPESTVLVACGPVNASLFYEVGVPDPRGVIRRMRTYQIESPSRVTRMAYPLHALGGEAKQDWHARVIMGRFPRRGRRFGAPLES